MGLFSGTGLTPGLKGITTNALALSSGETWVISPAGWYYVVLSKYHTIQQYDPITQTWRGVGSGNTGSMAEYFYSDGVNYRIVNQTGCPVGALLTNSGSGYVTAPTFAPNTGNSIWKAILGGAVGNGTVGAAPIITNGGLNYTYPPTVWVSPPPAGGIQATMTCTISSGVVNTLTVVDQGAGYTSAPQIVFINDPREVNPATSYATGTNVPAVITQGYNAAATCSLTGSGTVTGLLLLDHGQGNQSSIVTLTASSGAAAATVIMNWTITSLTITTAGAGLANGTVGIQAIDNFPTTASALTNPTTQSNWLFTRPAVDKVTISGGAVTSTTPLYDGGCYSSVPSVTVLAPPFIALPTTAPVLTPVMGGATGVSYFTQL
jgi:hypothetical protein